MESLTSYYEREYEPWVGRVKARGHIQWDAEDIVQEAFTTAVTYWNTFNPKMSSIPTWFTLILNQTEWKMRRDVLSDPMEFDENILDEGTVKEAYDDELAAKIIGKIENEPKAGKKNVLWLHLVCGCKVGDVSKQLGVPYRVVTNTIQRFKERIRDEYGGND